MGSGNACCCVVSVVAISVLVMVVALVASSLKKLESKEVGVQYDTLWKDLDDKIYTEGLHLGPVGYEFVKFPNVYTQMYLSDIACLNSDGVSITVKGQYQYRVQLRYLKEVLLNFKDFDGFQKVLAAVGTSAFHEACSYFNTIQFQADRGSFQDKLTEILKDRYNELRCDVEDVQITDVKRPNEYESAIKSKERAKEDISVAKQEGPRQIKEAETKLKEAESEAQIILDKANSDARIKATLAKSEAEAIIQQYEKEAEAYEDIMSSSGLNFSPEAFISYLGVRVISDSQTPVYVGMDSPAKTSYIKG